MTVTPAPELQGVLRAVAEATSRSLDTVVDVTTLHRHYFSMIFFVQWADGTAHAVKLARTDLRGRADRLVDDVTDADRALAHAEIDSLTRLAAEWEGEDLQVRWVRLVAELPEWAGLVTERVKAVDVCDSYRRLALRAAAGSHGARRGLTDRMRRCGTALGRFHRRHGREREADTAALAARIDALCRQLPATALPAELAREMSRGLEQLSVARLPDVETRTLKGIDVRNVLEAADGAIWLLDPGKTKWASREADVTRFALTWRILFWGSPWFLAGLTPPDASERAFVDACDAGVNGDHRLRGAYFLKEAVKHWVTAHDSLTRRGVAGWQHRTVGRIYIDRFYQQEARRWLREWA